MTNVTQDNATAAHSPITAQLDPLDHLVSQERLDWTDPTANLDVLELLEFPCSAPRNRLDAFNALPDHPDLLDPTDLRDLLDPMDSLERLEHLARMDNLDPPDHSETLEPRESLERLDNPVHPDRTVNADMVPQEVQDLLDHKDPKDSLELQDSLVALDNPVLKDLLDLPDKTERLERLEPMDSRVDLVFLVRMPLTAHAHHVPPTSRLYHSLRVATDAVSPRSKRSSRASGYCPQQNTSFYSKNKHFDSNIVDLCDSKGNVVEKCSRV